MTARHPREGYRGPMSSMRRWFARRLMRALIVARLRLWARMAAATIVIAVLAGAAAFSHGVLTSAGPDIELHQALRAAVLAVLASALTGAGLYPILRQRDTLLLHAKLTIVSDSLELLSILGKLAELRGGDTAGHNLRVACYTLFFAETLRLPAQQLILVVKGAFLHDIGKLVIPDGILNKAGPLTDEERREMSSHVIRGVEIARQSHFLSDATPIVAGHHEHFDGTGYPQGLAGEQIAYEARVFALIDVFDALTSPRVYKSAMSASHAIEIMAKDRGRQFDPQLFDIFKDVAPSFIPALPAIEHERAALLARRMRPHFDRLLRDQPHLRGNPGHDIFPDGLGLGSP